MVEGASGTAGCPGFGAADNNCEQCPEEIRKRCRPFFCPSNVQLWPGKRRVGGENMCVKYLPDVPFEYLFTPLFIGLDFGLNLAIVLAQITLRGKLMIIDEFVLGGRNG